MVCDADFFPLQGFGGYLPNFLVSVCLKPCPASPSHPVSGCGAGSSSESPSTRTICLCCAEGSSSESPSTTTTVSAAPKATAPNLHQQQQLYLLRRRQQLRISINNDNLSLLRRRQQLRISINNNSCICCPEGSSSESPLVPRTANLEGSNEAKLQVFLVILMRFRGKA